MRYTLLWILVYSMICYLIPILSMVSKGFGIAVIGIYATDFRRINGPNFLKGLVIPLLYLNYATGRDYIHPTNVFDLHGRSKRSAGRYLGCLVIYCRSQLILLPR